MSFSSDAWHTLIRRVIYYRRQPVFIFSTVVQPLFWLLLFAPLFQNIALEPGFPASYLAFFTPGVIVILAIYSSIFSGFIIGADINFSVLEKILVTPVNRYALMLGEVLSSTLILYLQVIIVFAIALLLGVSIITSITGVLLTLVIVGSLNMAIAALSNAFIIKMKNSETLGALSAIVTLPLLFISSILVPSSLAPSWAQTAMRFNPVNYAVEAIRPLFISGFDWQTFLTGLTVLTIFAAVAIVIATLTLRNYGK